MTKIVARYKGYLLNANCRSNEKVLLWGEDKRLLDLGFNEDKEDDPVTYDSIVPKSELEELYEEREYGTWNGMEFELDGGAPKGWYGWLNDKTGKKSDLEKKYREEIK